MQRRQHTTVWVIMHYEFMFEGTMDCLQFHVASSLNKAEKYIRKRSVMPYSWWQVHPYVIDDDREEGIEVHYYSYRGTKLTKAPHQQAKKAFERAKKKGQL